MIRSVLKLRSLLGVTAALLVFALVSRAHVDAQTVTTVGLYELVELNFTAQTTPANPFDTYLLKLEVTDPQGQRFTIDGFYDGNGAGGQTGSVWKARLSPYSIGTWSWRTLPGDNGTVDPGLANQAGQFQVVDRSARGGIVADGSYFRYQNGEHVFLIGNFLDFSQGLPSTHVLWSETLDDAQRDAVIAQQRDQHSANKINLYFANRGDYDGASVTPWLGSAANPNRSQMDLARWLLYDRYLNSVQANGMIAELWFFADDSNFGRLSAADRERLIRYALARTSAHAHTMYVLALEWQETFEWGQVAEMGSYLHANNPWRRPVSVHTRSLTGWDFNGQPWANFMATQPGNDSDPATVNGYMAQLRAVSSLPHLAEEFGLLYANSDARLRGNAWAAFTGGAAGVGTGSDLRALRGFLDQTGVPFWNMAPANSLVEDGGVNRFALAQPDQHYIVYSGGGSFQLNVSGTNLVGYWFNPRDPNATLSAPFSVSGSGHFTPPNDVNADWVLYITVGDAPAPSPIAPTATEALPTVTPTSAPPTETLTPTETSAPTETVLPTETPPLASPFPPTLVPPTVELPTLESPTLSPPTVAPPVPDPVTGRVLQNLQALYTFAEGAGTLVNDVSGVGLPLNLQINGSAAWLPGGGLMISSPTWLTSGTAADKILTAVRSTNEITVEVWVRPYNVTDQRRMGIVTLMNRDNERNLSFGQWANRANLQFLATNGADTDLHVLSTGSTRLTGDLVHLVFTFDVAGNARIYHNGVEAAWQSDHGDFSLWEADSELVVGNLLIEDQPWYGELHLVAIYDRALSAAEIAQNLSAGARRQNTPMAAEANPFAGQAFPTLDISGAVQGGDVQPTVAPALTVPETVDPTVDPLLATLPPSTPESTIDPALFTPTTSP